LGTYAFLAETLNTKYGVDQEAIKPETALRELGLDSLSVVELLFDAEDEFGIEVPEERAVFHTLGEAAAILDELVLAKEP